MKANIETVDKSIITADVNISDSPIGIVKNIYETDPANGARLFTNQVAIDQLLAGDVDNQQSQFTLLSNDGEGIICDWKTALCEQPSVKTALAELEANGRVPTFLVSVSQIVAA